MTTMRSRFYDVTAEALDDDPDVAVVLADIGVSELPRHPRVFNVGIREQAMIGVAAGLALEGYRPVVHSYAPFLVERPYEQLKLDLGHQDAGAVLVSVGASYDSACSGRTHQAPEDVPVVATLPGWTIHVPGHPDEVERLYRRSLAERGRVYLRLSEEMNREPIDGDGLVVLRRGSEHAPVVVAVGPTLGPAFTATVDLDVTVAYLATVRPFDVEGLRAVVGGNGRRARRAVPCRDVVSRGVGRAPRPPAPAARARRRRAGAAALRHGRGPPAGTRPRRQRASAARSTTGLAPANS